MRRLVLALLLALLPVAAASASGLEPQIAFSTSHDVVVASADGSGRFGLTGGRFGSVGDAAWSPDGRHVAFSTIGADGRQIVVASSDASDVRVVASSAGDDLSSPTFSPDGARVAYLDTTSAGGDVWVVRAGGGPPTRLTTDGARKVSVAWSPTGLQLLVVTPPSTISTIDASTGAETKVADGLGASWSPDGTRIAVRDLESHLVVLRADGTGARELAPRVDSTPAWSADGSTIVFEQDTQLGPSGKFGPPIRSDVMSVAIGNGSAPVRLTGPPAGVRPGIDLDDGRLPTISPDGSQVSYLRQTSLASLDRTVWEMNPDGSCRRPVAGLADVVAGPHWRPGTRFGAAVDCVDLHAYAVPPGAYAPMNGRANVQILVWNDGNQPATGVVLKASAKGDAASPPRCLPDCSLGSLPPGGTASAIVDAATGGPGALTFDVVATADQQSIDPSASETGAFFTVLPCTIVGSDGADRLVGTPHADHICGKPGADWISGGAGDDYIDAGNGNDTVYGGPGHDTILGRGGRDTIFARDGQRDWIDCGSEYDVAVVDRLDHVSHCERVLRR